MWETFLGLIFGGGGGVCVCGGGKTWKDRGKMIEYSIPANLGGRSVKGEKTGRPLFASLGRKPPLNGPASRENAPRSRYTILEAPRPFFFKQNGVFFSFSFSSNVIVLQLRPAFRISASFAPARYPDPESPFRFLLVSSWSGGFMWYLRRCVGWKMMWFFARGVCGWEGRKRWNPENGHKVWGKTGGGFFFEGYSLVKGK